MRTRGRIVSAKRPLTRKLGWSFALPLQQAAHHGRERTVSELVLVYLSLRGLPRVCGTALRLRLFLDSGVDLHGLALHSRRRLRYLVAGLHLHRVHLAITRLEPRA